MSVEKNKLNIIFVGSVIDKKNINLFSDASIAGNKMQIGFIKGLKKNNANVKVISVEPQKMWKFNKKPILIKSKKRIIEKCKTNMISFINLPILKQISIYLNIYKNLNNINFNNNTIIIVYNTMSFFALPVLKISKKKKCKSLAIVADLPIIKKKNLTMKIEDKIQEKLISRFDGIIPLTENIAHDFAPNKPYCLVEAGYDPSDYVDIKIDEYIDSSSKKIWNIVFSGTLNELSGIQLVLSAMDLVKNKNIILNIYGDGELKKYVIDASKKNSNICYHGKVDNNEMISIQANCDVLICPRCSDNYTTKYTFPSKILEYLCVGVPIICNPLPGIPKEYDKYLCYCESENKEDWANTIKKVISKDYNIYKTKALEAKQNFIKEKTWDAQCKKVIKFLKSI